MRLRRNLEGSCREKSDDIVTEVTETDNKTVEIKSR
jgi:hypothetical protein